MQSQAYWISPAGQVVDVATSHIATVIADPGFFRLTLRGIEAVYAQHGERVGLEGTAREAILTDLLCRRWIRLREHRHHWSIQFSTASPRTRVYVGSWARAAMRQGIVRDRHAEVHLEGLHDGFRLRVQMMELVTSMPLKSGDGERWRLRWSKRC